MPFRDLVKRSLMRLGILKNASFRKIHIGKICRKAMLNLFRTENQFKSLKLEMFAFYRTVKKK